MQNDAKRNKRILWLLNHTTLRKWEVPFLIRQGYEVFCPKSYNADFGDLSATITYEYDKTLTIPKSVLENLNSQDLYNPISLETISIMNEYFGIAICAVMKEPMKSLLLGYSGEIVVQCFGLAGEGSFSNVVEYVGGRSMIEMIKKKNSHFWFSASYDNLVTIEPDYIKRRTLYMPISFPNNEKIRWKGGDHRLLFVSPKIKTNPYYSKVYQDFKNNFSGIPHLIAGAQLIDVPEDKNVTGFLAKDDYEYVMQYLDVMFYHSQEPRHIHYHPLEAVQIGMPLIFMAGGMLDNLGGRNLPGRCKNVREARKKIKRVLKGDRLYTRKLIKSQKVLLTKTTAEYCEPYWIEALSKIQKNIVENKIDDCKKIAVILPVESRGEIYDFSIRFALSMHQAIINQKSRKYEIVFAVLKKVENEYGLKKLQDAGISVRRLTLEDHDIIWQKEEHEHSGIQSALVPVNTYSNVTALCDGMNDFRDCDYAFIMTDIATSSPIYLTIPYGIVVHDVIQRYFPHVISKDIAATKFLNMCNADSVLTTSEPTKEDVIQLGLDNRKVHLIPPMFSIDECIEAKKTVGIEYFLWSTNIAQHKNHVVALNALEDYYDNGGELDVFVTGVNTVLLDPDNKIPDEYKNIKYLKIVRRIIDQSENLKKHLHFLGNISKTAYHNYLSNSRFVFLPQYGDNGNFTLVDAASAGVAAVCSDYPAMRYMADYCGITPLYFSPCSYTDISKKLQEMEKNETYYKKLLPTITELKSKNYIEMSDKLLSTVETIIC